MKIWKKNKRMVNSKFDTRKNEQLRYMDRYHLDENNQEEAVPRQNFIKNLNLNDLSLSSD